MSIGVGLVSFTTLPTAIPTTTLDLGDDTPVWDVLSQLGKIKMNQVDPNVAGVSAQRGADLIFRGYSAEQDGEGKTKLQSPHFKCTACHNTKQEVRDLADINAQDRLEYAIEQDLPFLQGSTFHGIVNRATFYNDDYQKKYNGVEGIRNSFNDIRAAIRFCATECAQGRALEDWEVESILAYFWTKELLVKDLKLKEDEKQKINQSLKDEKNVARAIHLMEDHYLRSSPAHFSEQDMEYKPLTEGQLNDKKSLENGKQIYERGCLHCHGEQKYSFFNLDDSELSFKQLLKKTKKNDRSSIYKITRHGTYSYAGKKAYMPQYPLEKMSDAQLQDLRVYIENKALGN